MFGKVEDAADLETVKNSVSVGSSVKEEKPIHQDTKHESGAVKTTSVLRISPAAKMLILEHGLDKSSLRASGAHGTLLKGDVLAAIKSGIGSSKVSSKEKAPSSPQAHTKIASASADSRSLKQIDFEEFPNSQIRKVGFIHRISRFGNKVYQFSFELTLLASWICVIELGAQHLKPAMLEPT